MSRPITNPNSPWRKREPFDLVRFGQLNDDLKSGKRISDEDYAFVTRVRMYNRAKARLRMF